MARVRAPQNMIDHIASLHDKYMQYLLDDFGFDVEKYHTTLVSSRAFFSGSTLIQILTGDRWSNSDLDIYVCNEDLHLQMAADGWRRDDTVCNEYRTRDRVIFSSDNQSIPVVSNMMISDRVVQLIILPPDLNMNTATETFDLEICKNWYHVETKHFYYKCYSEIMSRKIYLQQHNCLILYFKNFRQAEKRGVPHSKTAPCRLESYGYNLTTAEIEQLWQSLEISSTVNPVPDERETSSCCSGNRGAHTFVREPEYRSVKKIHANPDVRAHVNLTITKHVNNKRYKKSIKQSGVTDISCKWCVRIEKYRSRGYKVFLILA